MLKRSWALVVKESRFFVERWGIIVFSFSISPVFPLSLAFSSSGLGTGSSAVEFFYLQLFFYPFSFHVLSVFPPSLAFSSSGLMTSSSTVGFFIFSCFLILSCYNGWWEFWKDLWDFTNSMRRSRGVQANRGGLGKRSNWLGMESKKHLGKEFEMKDLGLLRYFLGMEVARSKKSNFHISKEAYFGFTWKNRDAGVNLQVFLLKWIID